MAAKTWVVLLRGINVNPSTRVSMATLREILGGLGFSNITTLLQSGNVILDADADAEAVPDVGRIESAIARGTTVKSSVVVLSAETFRTIVSSNPLLTAGDDLSKLVITFVHGDIVPTDVDRPYDEELAPEQLVITSRAIYQWCPNGILKSKLKSSWWKQFGSTVTARNVRTANRIIEALDKRQSA